MSWDLLIDAGKDLLKKAFKSKGFQKPQVDYDEDKISMTLILAGTDITGSGTVDDEFLGRYWRGKLRATASGGMMSHDKITVVLTIRHFTDPHPHQGDKNEGELKEVASLSISAEGKAGTRKKAKRIVARHPEAHNDIYITTLEGVAVDSKGFNNITSWKLTVKVRHTDLEREFLVDPESLAQLPGKGNNEFAYVTLTPIINQETHSMVVALRADDKLHGLSRLIAQIEYGNTLRLVDGGVRAGDIAAHAEVLTTDLAEDKTELHLKFQEPAAGPGTLALIDFDHVELPFEQQNRMLKISRIEAFKADGSRIDIQARSADTEIPRRIVDIPERRIEIPDRNFDLVI